MVCLLDPAGLERRTKKLNRHRGEYIVPGPDHLWSVDGYLKLERYGIEIYAGIDAYSRYVVWCYVGITARTQESVLQQYIASIQQNNTFPRFIRSDRGTETPLMAAAHLQTTSE